jgi:hypothetical protein
MEYLKKVIDDNDLLSCIQKSRNGLNEIIDETCG